MKAGETGFQRVGGAQALLQTVWMSKYCYTQSETHFLLPSVKRVTEEKIWLRDQATEAETRVRHVQMELEEAEHVVNELEDQADELRKKIETHKEDTFSDA